MSGTLKIYRLGTMALCLGALMACDTIGNPFQALGTRPPAPDEFQVVSRKPLNMPSGLALPEPRLGERSPLDPTPERDALTALLGPDAGTPIPSASAGEQALLAAANANSSNSEIRQVIQEDLVTADSNEKYEPPSIFEVFGSDGKQPVKDALNPAAEARRLQTQGIAAAPIDPDDRPAAAAAPKSDEGLNSDGNVLTYDTADGKPKRPLEYSTPAFE
jgi:hypothetical protein